jgi:hypothetical protein
MTAPVIGGTTSQFRTDSFTELQKTVRRVLLDYKSAVVTLPNYGKTARDVLGERLYLGAADDAQLVFPHAVMRLDTDNRGNNHGMRLDGALEVLIHGKPWSQLGDVHDVADLFDQCMLSLVENHQGLIFCHGFSRLQMPRGTTAPIDGEVCTVRVQYTLAIWPAFLTSLTRVLT